MDGAGRTGAHAAGTTPISGMCGRPGISDNAWVSANVDYGWAVWTPSPVWRAVPHMQQKGRNMVYAKIAAVSALIAGWLALVMALNANLGGDGVGAGVLMVAAALAFGSTMWADRRA
jgi:hypothetical protein